MPVLGMAASKDGVASYCRFSSKNQDDRTIADQQRQWRQRAVRDGHVSLPLMEFADEAESGAKHSRRDFDRMMAAARERKIRVLYFVNLSRLARDCVLTLQTLRELVCVHKIRVISIDEGLDTAQSDSWELIAAILAVQHEQFLKKLAQDVFRGQEGVVLDQYCVGDYCFGYCSEPVPGTESKGKGRNKSPKTRYIVEWNNAGWVVKIFYWFVEDRQSLRWIARELNRLGAPKDHRATTPEWYHQLLTHLLSNRKYIGWWAWGENKNVRDPMNGKIRQQARPATETDKWLRHFPELQIIDDEIFTRAQKLLEENTEKCGSHRHADGQLRGSSRPSHDAHPRHLLCVVGSSFACAPWRRPLGRKSTVKVMSTSILPKPWRSIFGSPSGTKRLPTRQNAFGTTESWTRRFARASAAVGRCCQMLSTSGTSSMDCHDLMGGRARSASEGGGKPTGSNHRSSPCTLRTCRS